MRKRVPNAILAVLAVASLLATAAITATVVARQAAPAVAEEPPLEVYFDVPAFELTTAQGQPFGSDDLRGKIWVADFMFTRCSAVCPMLSANMAAVQAALAGKPWAADVRLVSVSLDADHDTPAILREYAQMYSADPARWTFLTGPREEVWPLVEKGFKLTVAEDAGNAAMPISHSSMFALVDRQGRIRAYHDGMTAEGRAALLRDIERLAAEEPQR